MDCVNRASIVRIVEHGTINIIEDT